jgi:hypothetical protein
MERLAIPRRTFLQSLGGVETAAEIEYHREKRFGHDIAVESAVPCRDPSRRIGFDPILPRRRRE